MNDNEVMELGGYCETLLSSPSFQILAAKFEAQQVEQILINRADDQEQRDRISRAQGFREFLSFLGITIQRQQQLIAEADQVEPDHSDDPSVHDIFDYEPHKGVTTDDDLHQ